MKITLLLLLLTSAIFSRETIDVVVADFEPVVFEKEGKLSGYEIDLLKLISTEIDVKFNFTKKEFKDIFTSIDSGTARIGSAGITINNTRYDNYDFSYPHIKTGLSILVKNENNVNISGMLFKMFRDNILTFTIYVVYLLLVSLFIYLLEFKSEAFSDNLLKGMFQAFYYANTTATTVGYGDFTPKRVISRLFVIVFLFYPSIVFSGIIIGTITSSINLSSQIYAVNDKSDLENVTIGAINNTTSYDIAKSLSKSVVSIDRNDCEEMLKGDFVKAVIFDDVFLSNIAKNNKKYVTVGNLFNKEDYGFVFKKGDPLRKEFDRVIIKFMSDGTLDELNKKWFNK